MNLPLILGGPSGTGKSSFGKFLELKGWLYIEVDQFPRDGIANARLRSEWDAFWNQCNANPLARELNKRKEDGGAKGVLLSLPGTAVPSLDHLRAADGVALIRFLYGHPRYCLKAFLDRERAREKPLDEAHWDANNPGVYCALSRSAYHPYLIQVFREDGQRIPWEDVAKIMEQS